MDFQKNTPDEHSQSVRDSYDELNFSSAGFNTLNTPSHGQDPSPLVEQANPGASATLEEPPLKPKTNADKSFGFQTQIAETEKQNQEVLISQGNAFHLPVQADNIAPKETIPPTPTPPMGIQVPKVVEEVEGASDQGPAAAQRSERAKISLRSVIVSVFIFGFIGAAIAYAFIQSKGDNAVSDITKLESGVFAPGDVVSLDLPTADQEVIKQLVANQSLTVNGLLRAQNTVVIEPTARPITSSAGQVYVDEGDSNLYFYNGTDWQPLVTQSQLASSGVTSIGGASGDITLGAGLAISGTTLSNSGVISITGTANQVVASSTTGAITLSLPQSIATTSAPTFAGLTLSGNLLPTSDNTIDIGSPSLRIANIYANNISGTISPAGLTEGSVVFAGPGGALSQDNANFFWDNANNRLGIGTTSLTSKLSVVAGANQLGLSVTGQTLTGDNDQGLVNLSTTWDTIGVPTAFKLSVIDMLSNVSSRLVDIDVGGTRMFTIQKDGDVGIGADPSEKLEISDTSSTNSRTGFRVVQSGAMSGTGYALQAFKAGASLTNVAGYFSAIGATNNYGLIVENGSVGIGTTTPILPLDVTAPSGGAATVAVFKHNTTFPIIRLLNNNSGTDVANGTVAGRIDFTPFHQGADNLQVAFIQSVYGGDGTTRIGDLRFATANGGSPNAVMTLTADSTMLLIGNSATPLDAGVRLQVQGAASEKTAILRANATTPGNILELQTSTPTTVMSIGSTGTALFQNSSDTLTGFQIFDADGGTPILNVDTTNERLGIGTAAPSRALHVVGNIRATSLASCDTIDTDASGNFACGSDSTGGGGGGATNLQEAYEGGNSINVTTSEGNLAFNLSSADFILTTPTDGANFTTIVRADGTGTTDPAQLLLIDNQDTDRAQPVGLKIQAEAGGITDAIDLTDTDLVNALNIGDNIFTGTSFTISGTTAAIDFTNFDVTSAGDTTVAGTFLANGNVTLGNAATDLLTFTGTIQGANAFVLEGGSADDFELTLSVASLTDDRSIAFPDGGGTVCLTSGNCAGVGGQVGGTGTANRVAYWTTTSDISADDDFFFDGSDIMLGTSAAFDAGVRLQVQGAANEKTAILRANATTPGNVLEIQDSAGTTNWSVAPSGRTGINTPVADSTLLAIAGNHPSTADTIRGLQVSFVAPSTATSDFASIRARLNTAAAVFNLDTSRLIYLDNPSIGAGSTVTHHRGIHIEDQGHASITNAYGILVLSQTSASGVSVAARFDRSDTAALWLEGATDSTDPQAGIVFGQSRDTNLYRGAANQLKTDDQLLFNGAATDITTGPNETLTLAPNGTGAVTINSGATSGNALDLQANSVNTGTVFNLSATGLTTGSGIFTSFNNGPSSGALTANAMVFGLVDSASGTYSGSYRGANFSFQNNGAVAHSQTAVVIENNVAGTSTDLTTENLLLIDQADTTTAGNTAVTNALNITNSGGSTLTNAITIGSGSQAIGTGINFASSGFTNLISAPNFSVANSGLITTAGDIVINGGDLTGAATFNLLDTGTGTINFGGNALAINVGDSGTDKTIDIGDVTNASHDTINIATNGTHQDTINIGNSHISTLVAITGGNDWSITAAGVVTYASGTTNTDTLVCRNSSGQLAACSNATLGGSAFIQGGNSFTAEAILGTNDSFALTFETAGTSKWRIETDGDLIPLSNDDYDIGADGNRVQDLYLGPGSLKIGASGDQSSISYNTGSDLLTFQNSADSATGFQFLDADGGTPILNVDTTSESVGIGIASPSAKLHVLLTPGADTAGISALISITGQDTIGSDEEQIALSLVQNGNGATVTEAADALLSLENNDTSDNVESAILFKAGASGTDFTYGINFDAAGFDTAEIVLQNAETIDNVTDGTISLGAPTVNLSGTSTLTASTLSTFTTAATLSWGGATVVTFTADNATINGSDAANGNLTLQGTTSATRTTSYVLLQPNGGNVGIGTTAPNTKLQIEGGADVSLANNAGFLVMGPVTGVNVVIDNNEIQARNNGVASTLWLNTLGGALNIGAGATPASINVNSGLFQVTTTGDIALTNNVDISVNGTDSIRLANDGDYVDFTIGDIASARALRIRKEHGGDGGDAFETDFYFSDNPTTEAGSLHFHSSGDSGALLTIASNGDVGIGDATPDARFIVTNATHASGNHVLFNPTQTTVNTTDTADTSLRSSYTLSASSASTHLISRGIVSNLTNSLTGGGALTNGRVYESSINTTSGATTTNGILYYGNIGTIAGTITNAYGLLINQLQGTHQIGAMIGSMAGSGNNTHLVLGQNTIPSGDYGIYNSSTFDNYFAGDVGIGTDGQSAKLAVSFASSTTDIDTVGQSLISNDSGGSTSDLNITRRGLHLTPQFDGNYNANASTVILYGLDNSTTFGGVTQNDASQQWINLYGTNTVTNFSGTVGDANEIIQVISVRGWAEGDIGTNGATTHYGGHFFATGTADTNYGIWASANSATNNYAAVFDQGNVGIGDTTPNALLHVSAAAQPIFLLSDTRGGLNDTSMAIIVDAAQSLNNRGIVFQSRTDAGGAQTNLVTIEDTGNVGIGTITPFDQLTNASTNVTDGTHGSTAGSSILWNANAAGYSIVGANASSAATAHGILARTTGVASTNKILTASANGTTVFQVLGDGSSLMGATAAANNARLTIDRDYSADDTNNIINLTGTLSATGTGPFRGGFINPNYTGAGTLTTMTGWQVSPVVSATSASSVVTTLHGIVTQPQNDSSNASTAVGTMYGILANPLVSGTGHTTTANAVQGTITVQGTAGITGDIGTATGGNFTVVHNSPEATSVITTARGVFVDITDGTAGTGGTIGTGIGILVNPMTDGTTANAGIVVGETGGGGNGANLVLGQTTVPTGFWSIYNNSLNKNYFRGRLGLGIDDPAYHLEIHDATDSPYLALTDDDIAQPFSAVDSSTLASQVFAGLTSINTTVGGARLTGVTDTTGNALELRGLIGSTNPTDTTPAVKIVGAIHNGSGNVADMAAAETVLQVVNNATALLTVRGDGGVGIGTATPAAGHLLDVAGQLQITLDGDATTEEALCGNQADGNVADTANVTISDCSNSPTADYMEMYSVDGGVEKGDIVAPSSAYVTTTTGDRVAKLAKTTTSYQGTALGIVSDEAKAGDFNSIGYNIREEDNPEPVALSGRVPVKVTTENGEINPGDLVTTSSVAGVGMKATAAGRVIGVALESYSGSDVGMVMVFVNPHYYVPSSTAGDTLVANGEFESLNVSGLATISNLTVTGTASFSSIVAENATINGVLTASEIEVATITVTGNLNLKGKVIASKDTVGRVKVVVGETASTFSFETPYGEKPTVIVTPEQDMGGIRYWIETTPGGFVIHLSEAVTAEMTFNYLVVGVEPEEPS